MASRRGSGLSAGQIAAAVFGFLVASFLVFVFGMWVGKDLAERRLAQEERVIRGPVARDTPQEAEVRDPDITFYERLREQAKQPQIIAPGQLPPTPTPREALIVVPTREPTPSRTSQTEVGTPMRVVPTPRQPEDEWADAGWTVQVSATTDPSDASRTVVQLRAKGFDAYTVRAPMRGRTWYRVRVGNFPTREQAKEMEKKLKTTEGMVNAYVTAR